MAKHITIPVNETTNMKLRLYAALLGSTKTDAAAKALHAGIPAWVMSISPAEAREVGQAEPKLANHSDDDLESILVDDDAAPHATRMGGS